MKLLAFELRQYAMKPGRRDELITLFERAFVETQEAAGIRLIGLFRDLDQPDRFVWMRGYPDQAARRPALNAFYNSDHWFAPPSPAPGPTRGSRPCSPRRSSCCACGPPPARACRAVRRLRGDARLIPSLGSVSASWGPS
jgi:quinol monooxygenase YgiN